MKKALSTEIPIAQQYSSHRAFRQQGNFRKFKPIGDLCLEIAEFAKERDYRTLDYLLKMAATEAYETSEVMSFDQPGHSEMVGLWDWDVSNNLAYVDAPSAKLFNVAPKASSRGLPLESYLEAIHPDDVKSFSDAVYRVASEGGCLETIYRIISSDDAWRQFIASSVVTGSSGFMPKAHASSAKESSL
jgi:PAS domain-containing protein